MSLVQWDTNDRVCNDLDELAKSIANLQLNQKNSYVRPFGDLIKILIVVKTGDDSLLYLARELVEWILIKHPEITLYIEDTLEDSEQLDVKALYKDSKCKSQKIQFWNQKWIEENPHVIDLVLTLGGDGTVLFVSSIFQNRVPPVLSFSLGSLGFLTTFTFADFKKDIDVTLQNKLPVNVRMRLLCKVYRKLPTKVDPATGKKIRGVKVIYSNNVLNEVTIDRGSSPFLSNLELYGNGTLFTVAQADGLIIATPTGSTAYSLSAGGSLVYPNVHAMVVTPICPNSLSFRPIILPETMVLQIKVPAKSRGTAWAAFDGKDKLELQRGDYIMVAASPFPFPTYESSPTQYIDSISRTLNWNLREPQKSFSSVLSPKNLEKYNLAESKKHTMQKSDSDVSLA
ncbi:hypothetical protein Kpol_370p7 [Vanderwaltozyma polyspora DSM 70294]|uniref:NAD(+) kinase n=1 Tax=Vanderwaltozyma polyspora (strain ATCC 22028 / DSM 70294 / BCRC 21397 / CBS 2163 / NBRC 10782 / NRRL Y-8283 / UCD 57-17) TaxID=436907 RepID=A7TSI0_VANPO|nr:uncharacterized protein Kpol_370p7 [Vanderwaltozyma polyspora DSM 70294]EDO14779.1 hypothetical protein Kpol_370p7 [Vanderwaltozyma polyspora DSM 70294]